MAIEEIYLDNAILSNVAYGNLNTTMNDDATAYIRELTRTDDAGVIKMTLDQAKAFAGVTEGDNVNGKIEYEYITNADGRASGYTILATSQGIWGLVTSINKVD